jgi:hypothetical protein
MNRTKCEWIRELIPDYAAGRLADDEIELSDLHFTGCNECRDELDLAHLIFSSRAMEPEGLADKIKTAVRNGMDRTKCEWIRELIPDYAAGRLADDEIELSDLHFTGCNECRDELDLAHLVFSSRAMEPEGLGEKINAAVHNRRVTGHRQWWGAAAAAVALLAIGLNVIMDRSGSGDLPLAESEFEIESENLWLTDDALIAGAPMLGGLSDEALRQLLEELIVGTSGGAA